MPLNLKLAPSSPDPTSHCQPLDPLHFPKIPSHTCGPNNSFHRCTSHILSKAGVQMNKRMFILLAFGILNSHLLIFQQPFSLDFLYTPISTDRPP